MRTGILYTNNPLFLDYKEKNLDVRYFDMKSIDLLIKVRDLIHQNYVLLTHPLHSSLKPNETPFRSVVISEEPANKVDVNSVELIQKAIETYKRFLRDGDVDDDWAPEIITDFGVIDYDIIVKGMAL